MLIKSITLSNFRIFVGTQTIRFSTDRSKNVTLIVGDNGSGKTTLAQAFTWCLYGVTSFTNAEDLLSPDLKAELPIGETATVRVVLNLDSNGREYSIARSRDYRKDSPEKFHANDNVLSVSYKAEDGQTEFIKGEAEKRDQINEIIPRSVSSYFFFDGERVDKLGTEIQEGQSDEFKVAVENLLGLSAISSAISHLEKVIRSYNSDYKGDADKDFQETERKIERTEGKIEDTENKLKDLKEKRATAARQRDKYKGELERAKSSRDLANERSELEVKKTKKEADIERAKKQLLKDFSESAWGFFAAPHLKQSIRRLENSESFELAHEVPEGVTAKTIQDIIDRGTCLCGTKIEFNSREYHELNEWLGLVPPEHLGATKQSYLDSCRSVCDSDTAELYDDIRYSLNNISGFEQDIEGYEQRINELNKLLEGAKDSSRIEKNYQLACREVGETGERIEEASQQLGALRTTLQQLNTKKASLKTDDETNKRVRRDSDYARFLLQKLKEEYSSKEEETRNDLEHEINLTFQEFFDSSLHLKLDDKYNIEIGSTGANPWTQDIETSEGQSVAIIFAFITAVIRLATGQKRQSDEMLITESYPLIMDAPVSKLDKKRIETVCEVVPKTAEQAIIMIKDTDGDLVRNYLSDKTGFEYQIEKDSEFKARVEEVTSRV